MEVVLDCTEVEELPGRLATRDEMLAAADRVFIGRGHTRGRNRKPAREGWLCLATQVLSGWAPTLRVCLLVAVGGVVVVGAVVSSAPAIGASVGTLVTGRSVLAVWTASARRVPEPRL